MSRRRRIETRLGVKSLDGHMGTPLGERRSRELPGFESDPAKGHKWNSPALERLYKRLVSA